jgi:hypothetical protein
MAEQIDINSALQRLLATYGVNQTTVPNDVARIYAAIGLSTWLL